MVVMTSIKKWGNSLAVRIPKQLAEQTNLEEGSEIEIRLVDNAIVITPKTKKYSLEELLAGAKAEDFSGEYDWGDSLGEEIW